MVSTRSFLSFLALSAVCVSSTVAARVDFNQLRIQVEQDFVDPQQCIQSKCASQVTKCQADGSCKECLTCLSGCKGDKSCSVNCVKDHFSAATLAIGECAKENDCLPTHVAAVEKHWTVETNNVGNGTHYGNPANGCESDEEAVQVQGISGDFCSPKCSSTTPCPTDVPAGTTVKPQCALQVQGASAPSMCALICSPLKKTGCPTGASCAKINFFEGLCTYPASN